MGCCILIPFNRETKQIKQQYLYNNNVHEKIFVISFPTVFVVQDTPQVHQETQVLFKQTALHLLLQTALINNCINVRGH